MRYPCAVCNSMASKPIRTARFVASTKLSRTRSISAAVISRGAGQAAERDGRRSNGLPSILVRCERLASLPRPARGGFTARVSELDAYLGGTVATAMGDHAGQRRLT